MLYTIPRNKHMPTGSKLPDANMCQTPQLPTINMIMNFAEKLKLFQFFGVILQDFMTQGL